jgi:diguanylate cyclase (GGDEF)-like protein
MYARVPVYVTDRFFTEGSVDQRSHWNMTIAMFAVLVAAAAAAIHYRAAWLRAARLADRDPLTGLLNRRGFDAAATGELARAQRFGRPLTLAYIDLDDFKAINDTHGHAAGDRLLAAVAGALAAGRACDVVARLGGDEFALLLPETDAGAAALAIERMREAAVSASTAAGLPISFSCGVITFDEAPSSLAAALAQVDGMLYERKRAKQVARGIASSDPLAATLRLTRRAANQLYVA